MPVQLENQSDLLDLGQGMLGLAREIGVLKTVNTEIGGWICICGKADEGCSGAKNPITFETKCALDYFTVNGGKCEEESYTP